MNDMHSRKLSRGFTLIEVLVTIVILAIGLLGLALMQTTSLSNQLVTIVVVAVIFGLINAFIKPVLKLFALPFIILTLGLFSLVVNALMLQLTSWFADQLNLAFHVDQFFWDALLGSIIITLVSMVLNVILPDD